MLERNLVKVLSSRLFTTILLVVQSVCAARLLGPEARDSGEVAKAAQNFSCFFSGWGSPPE